MRRQGILLLLIFGCVSWLATGAVWWVRVPRGVCRIACTKDCKIRSQLEEFWEPLGGCPRGASHRVFRSTLQGLNQSIVGLSPLSETTYSTSHEIPPTRQTNVKCHTTYLKWDSWIMISTNFAILSKLIKVPSWEILFVCLRWILQTSLRLQLQKDDG
jgi:hypothetical protein